MLSRGTTADGADLLFFADGEILAIFRNRPEIQRFLPDGSFLGMFQAGLKNPMGLCVDPFGRIWVADRNYASVKIVDGIIRVFGADGAPLFECGAREGTFTRLRNPGDLYLGDWTGGRVLRVAVSGLP